MNAQHLVVAAKLIRQLDRMGEPMKFEGVELRDLAWACTQAANETRIHEISDEILFSKKVPALHVIEGGAA